MINVLGFKLFFNYSVLKIYTVILSFMNHYDINFLWITENDKHMHKQSQT